MNKKFGIKYVDEDGKLHLDLGLSITDVQRAYDAGHIHVVTDRYGQELTYYHSTVSRYRMKHVGGAFFGRWHKTPGDALRIFKISPEYTDALTRVEGSHPDMLNPKKWKRVDQRDRPYQEGRDLNWDLTVPKEVGKYALVYRLCGEKYAVANSLNKVWMKSPHAVFTFVSQNGFPRKGSIVAKSLGDGKWCFCPEMDPHSGL